MTSPSSSFNPMNLQLTRTRAALLLGVTGLLSLSQAALAEGGSRSIPLLPAYQQECSTCHIAYPPTLMPAPSWSRVLNKLDQHFGVDASLDAASLKTISTWVLAHAGTYKRVKEEPPQDRITRTTWFVRQHHEVSAATWQRASVKSASNCAACHTTAEKGDFNERNVRIPR